ncbi:MAG: fasciclin domain-containing protein [Ginsengibacter sp.]
MKQVKLLALCSIAIFAACTSSNKMKKMDGMDDMNKTVMVGGAEMYPTKNIVENAVNSKDHTTLVAAVKAAGLVETLSGTGPFTVFAPVNQAFDALPTGTVETLLKPENKAKLSSVLTYHVVPGKLNSWDLIKMIKEGNGSATLTTVQGETLTIKPNGNAIMVTDQNGDIASVTIADVNQSNGVIHVIDKVMLPK